MGLNVGPRLVVQNPRLRRDKLGGGTAKRGRAGGPLGGGLLFRRNVCDLKNLGRWQPMAPPYRGTINPMTELDGSRMGWPGT